MEYYYTILTISRRTLPFWSTARNEVFEMNYYHVITYKYEPHLYITLYLRYKKNYSDEFVYNYVIHLFDIGIKANTH